MSIRGNLKYIIVLYLLATSLFASSVKLDISSSEVVDGSAVNVKITAEGKNVQFPTINDIGGFEVENKNISTNIESSYINGNFSTKNYKVLSFDFYPETNLTIPSYSVKIDGKVFKTKPKEIIVHKASESLVKTGGSFVLRLKSNKKSVYVGEPFLVTIDIVEPHNSRAVRIEYNPPVFKDFFSQQIGGEQKMDTPQGVIHRFKYMLSAKKDGTLTIQPPKIKIATSTLSGNNLDPFGMFVNDLRWQSVRGNSVTVDSKATPNDVDMVGHFKVSSSVDKKITKPNKPVTYTIKIYGDGTLDDLADPKFDIPGVTVYADDSKVKTGIQNGKVVSTYTRKYVFISDKSFTIPSLTFKEFDYVTHKVTKIRSKRFNIKVAGVLGVASSKQTPSATSAQTAAKQQTLITKKEKVDNNRSLFEDTNYYKQKAKSENREYPLWIILIAFLVGIVATVTAQYLYRLAKKSKVVKKIKHYEIDEALQILYPHTNQDKKIEEMVRKLYEIKNGNKEIKLDRKELDKIVDKVIGQ